jgi:3-deoxy-manno-octulosonate cytidylyltransferase (CMP-KDO synthetase)
MRDGDRNFDYVVNLQGDLPTIDPLAVQRCLAGLTNEGVDISTIAAPITEDADVANRNIVKVIAPLSDEREVAFARDFLRDPGPEYGPRYWHHIGIYAYRRESLERFVRLPVGGRELDRKLEQMRALDNGMKIAVVRVDTVPLGVDTPAELEAARRVLKAGRL